MWRVVVSCAKKKRGDEGGACIVAVAGGQIRRSRLEKSVAPRSPAVKLVRSN